MRGGKNPWVVELTTNIALLSGAAPVALIPTLCAFFRQGEAFNITKKSDCFAVKWLKSPNSPHTVCAELTPKVRGATGEVLGPAV